MFLRNTRVRRRLRGHAPAGALSAVAVRYRREAMRRWGEHGGHASGKRLASCRQAWCGQAAMAQAGMQRVGLMHLVWVQVEGWSLTAAFNG